MSGQGEVGVKAVGARTYHEFVFTLSHLSASQPDAHSGQN